MADGRGREGIMEQVEQSRATREDEEKEDGEKGAQLVS